MEFGELPCWFVCEQLFGIASIFIHCCIHQVFRNLSVMPGGVSNPGTPESVLSASSNAPRYFLCAACHYAQNYIRERKMAAEEAAERKWSLGHAYGARMENLYNLASCWNRHVFFLSSCPPWIKKGGNLRVLTAAQHLLSECWGRTTPYLLLINVEIISMKKSRGSFTEWPRSCHPPRRLKKTKSTERLVWALILNDRRSCCTNPSRLCNICRVSERTVHKFDANPQNVCHTGGEYWEESEHRSLRSM